MTCVPLWNLAVQLPGNSILCLTIYRCSRHICSNNSNATDFAVSRIISVMSRKAEWKSFYWVNYRGNQQFWICQDRLLIISVDLRSEARHYDLECSITPDSPPKRRAQLIPDDLSTNQCCDGMQSQEARRIRASSLTTFQPQRLSCRWNLIMRWCWSVYSLEMQRFSFSIAPVLTFSSAFSLTAE